MSDAVRLVDNQHDHRDDDDDDVHMHDIDVETPGAGTGAGKSSTSTSSSLQSRFRHRMGCIQDMSPRERGGFVAIFLAILIFVILAAVLDAKPVNPVKPVPNPEPSVPPMFNPAKAAVASDNPICSNIASQLMKDGGNAIDAGVAAALCIGVVNPYSSGIGGGGFFLLRLANGTRHFVNFRETAPMNSSQNMFVNRTRDASHGPRSVAVPGEVKGMYEVWQRYGKIAWSSVVTPAANLALNGFPVHKHLQDVIAYKLTDVLASPDLRAVYAPGGVPLKVGDTCVNTKLGQTLQSIATNGADVFYSGIIGQRIAQDIQAAGGGINHTDMLNYRVQWMKPLRGFYHGLEVLTGPPPSSGGVLILNMLNVLERYDLERSGITPLYYHRLVESMKWAYAMRMELGDPNFVNITHLMDKLMDKGFASWIRQHIDDSRTFPPEYYNDKEFIPLEDHGTTHISVIDEDRNAISFTSTINLYFGSTFVSPQTGVLLNDEMDDFSTPGLVNAFGVPPSPANFIEPGKRPLSSMSPTIVVRDGDVRLVVGAAGGTRIITSTLQSLLNQISFGMEADEALKHYRVHHQFSPDKLYVEAETPTSLRDFLTARGHIVEEVGHLGVVQSISRFPQNGTLGGACDTRGAGEGKPSGF